MNRLLAAAAALALFAGAGTASAQMYQPLNPAMNRGAMQPMPYEQTALPPWMTDDGSSSDHPVHNPGDISGDRLNAQYQGGIYTAPGHGFPAYPGVYEEER